MYADMRMFLLRFLIKKSINNYSTCTVDNNIIIIIRSLLLEFITVRILQKET